MLAGGYWLGVETDDLGESFSEVPIPNSEGGTAQIASLATSPITGTIVAVGYYNHLSRLASDQMSFEGPTTPPRTQPCRAGWDVLGGGQSGGGLSLDRRRGFMDGSEP